MIRTGRGKTVVFAAVACIAVGAAVFMGRGSDGAPESALSRAAYAGAEAFRNQWYQLLYLRLNVGAAHGKEFYAQSCAGCHGVNGDDGKAANLAVSQLPRAASDTALHDLILSGIRGTGMPGTVMEPDEAWQIVAHVRRLGKAERPKPPGDASRGKQLLEVRGGCLSCHMIRDEGQPFGPDLTSAGIRWSVGALREALLHPPVGADSLVVGSGNSRVTGMRVNEDAFSLQIRDAGGQIHSYLKDEITSREKPAVPLMPSYEKVFSAAELDDVVAYLSSLRRPS